MVPMLTERLATTYNNLIDKLRIEATAISAVLEVTATIIIVATAIATKVDRVIQTALTVTRTAAATTTEVAASVSISVSVSVSISVSASKIDTLLAIARGTLIAGELSNVL
ncbi:hypothetical protein HZH66_014133 [Vespula vulgaris]|uniref:Uncharacterized protein n=1 Tax=Vespula vulgaris TaxID=7454 RepID=A0A834J532_VESVU|nr:hypothetical protein HZH66_014133 [Vespula vulgaris]